MSEYEKQANDFCEKYGVSIGIKFLQLEKNTLWEDKEERPRYSITIKRESKTKKLWIFDFWGSINEADIRKMIEKFERSGYVTSRYYSKELARYKKLLQPVTSYDILACLTKYEPQLDIEDFMDEFGLEVKKKGDIRRFQDMHYACHKEWREVQLYFGDCLEELRDIQ